MDKFDGLSFEEVGKAMRPMLKRDPVEAFRLSREERDHIAGHALDDLEQLARDLEVGSRNGLGCSDVARKITALSNLLGDIGWHRETAATVEAHPWTLGELFPVAQLRPWLEKWQRRDDEALKLAEEVLEVAKVAINRCEAEPTADMAVGDAQTKLATGAILLVRIEKWMASHGN